MTLDVTDRPAVSSRHARQAMVAAMNRTREGLSGAEPVDDVRTLPLDRDLRLVVEAVGRSAAVNGTEASSVMGGSVVSAAVVLRGPAVELEAGGAVTDVTMGAREGDFDVGAEIVGLLGESP